MESPRPPISPIEERSAALREASAFPPLRPRVYPLNDFDLSVVVNTELWPLLRDALEKDVLDVEVLLPEYLLRLVAARQEELAERLLAMWDFEDVSWPLVVAREPGVLNKAVIRWLDAHFDVAEQFAALVNCGAPEDTEKVLSAVNDYFERSDYDAVVAEWLLRLTGFQIYPDYFEVHLPSPVALRRMIAAGVVDPLFESPVVISLWDVALDKLAEALNTRCALPPKGSETREVATFRAEAIARMRVVLAARKQPQDIERIAQHLRCDTPEGRRNLRRLLASPPSLAKGSARPQS